MMSFLDKNMGETGVRVTFCVTASLLKNHPGFFEGLRAEGHELAAHGFFHTDMKKKSRAEQAKIVMNSFRAFESSGLLVRGFRCPYLSYNSDTIKAISASPFLWTSNNVIFWEGLPGNNNDILKKLSYLYRLLDAKSAMSLPLLRDKLVDIPITAPDDEMILERCRIKDPREIRDIWTRISKKIHERGELFHLLFHPERFTYVKDAIKAVININKNLYPSVWFASLDEITSWWEKRRLACWGWQKTGKNGIRLVIQVPNGSTLLIKSSHAGTERFYKNYSVIEPAITDEGMTVLNAEKFGDFTIGISSKCPAELEEFLNDEGFLVERTNEAGKHALYIDGYEKFNEENKPALIEEIDSSPAQLIRLWRWPSGKKSAFTISSDVDSINVGDFFQRIINF